MFVCVCVLFAKFVLVIFFNYMSCEDDSATEDFQNGVFLHEEATTTPLASSHIVRESSTLRSESQDPYKGQPSTAIIHPPKTKLKTLENPHLSGV